MFTVSSEYPGLHVTQVKVAEFVIVVFAVLQLYDSKFGSQTCIDDFLTFPWVDSHVLHSVPTFSAILQPARVAIDTHLFYLTVKIYPVAHS